MKIIQRTIPEKPELLFSKADAKIRTFMHSIQINSKKLLKLYRMVNNLSILKSARLSCKAGAKVETIYKQCKYNGEYFEGNQEVFIKQLIMKGVVKHKMGEKRRREKRGKKSIPYYI